MAEVATLRREDGIGLAIAGALHVGVVALLLLQPVRSPDIIPEVEGIAVSLATDVSLTSTAPDPVPEAAAATAPVLGEEPAADISQPAPAVSGVPPPPSRQVTSPTRSASPPEAQPTRRVTPPSDRPAPNRRNGGSQIGDDFLPGPGTSSTSTDTRLPASEIGRSAIASIQSQMARELRPHWAGKVPTGVDDEKLVTIVSFQLNPDGSLKGSPRVVRQRGVTPANEAQKGRHAEIALRAVRLAAPFDLPEEYYNAWKSIRALSFDRNLAR